MQPQTITFESKGQRIAGHLYQPQNREQPLAAIILCHGFCGVKELLLPAYAEKFSQAGYLVLTFDYRGFGESEGESGRLVPEMQVQDIHAATDWLLAQPGVDPQRVVLWGSSFGGANAIVAAAEDSRIKCVLAQLTFADGERVITGQMGEEEKQKFLATLEKMRAKKLKTGKEMMVPIAKVLGDEQSLEFFESHKDDFPALTIKIPFLTVWETLNHKPELSLQKMQQPLLIVAAELDGVNPLSESEALFAKANEPKMLYIEPGARHYDLYRGEALDRVVAKQLEWLELHL
ncbi:UilS family quorum-quenching N-acyl-homoserine lactonase [Dongshaea marina]|uniref:UilS family quorum-quenching N-acyl-homoserine lactonase n=1 Tax=Dongshaea marina TaxID=2047966 RepID=UPI000D3E8FE2|nr:alpha/beta fold hydrolase [Dongshaea marina]